MLERQKKDSHKFVMHLYSIIVPSHIIGVIWKEIRRYRTFYWDVVLDGIGESAIKATFTNISETNFSTIFPQLHFF